MVYVWLFGTEMIFLCESCLRFEWDILPDQNIEICTSNYWHYTTESLISLKSVSIWKSSINEGWDSIFVEQVQQRSWLPQHSMFAYLSGGIQHLCGQNFAIFWHFPPTWTVLLPWAWTKTDFFDPLPPLILST